MWLGGNGAVAINNGIVLDTGEKVTNSLVERYLSEAVETLRPIHRGVIITSS